jgi:bile acid:Na+ symporter, BASS family
MDFVVPSRGGEGFGVRGHVRAFSEWGDMSPGFKAATCRRTPRFQVPDYLKSVQITFGQTWRSWSHKFTPESGISPRTTLRFRLSIFAKHAQWRMAGLLLRLTNLFWLWTILGVVWAWLIPGHFTWFLPYIPLGLAIIMLGMGLTLSVKDFRDIGKQPMAVLAGVVAQYLIMPASGYCIARLFHLPDGLAAGLILVACCPGGTASNVITYLAKGDVGLSVLMTMCSTFLAVVMTPLLTGWLAGAYVEVDRMALFRDTAMVVLLPVAGGLLLNQFASRWLAPVQQIAPLVSVIGIVLIVGAIMGKQKAVIAEAGFSLIGAVFLLHLFGFALGYGLSKMLGHPVSWRRTISIETGMQNSGLGATLARSLPHPAAAAPSALSAFCHCLIGTFLAAWWRLRPTDPVGTKETPPIAADRG